MNQPFQKKYLSPWKIVYFLIGLALLIFLLLQIDFLGLVRLILSIQPAYLLLGGAVYFCKALVRSVRFTRINARSQLNFLKMLRLSLASSLASQLLPLKLGEFSYVYLLKKESQSSVAQGLSTLMIIRIFDLLAIALLFVLIALIGHLPSKFALYFYALIGFILFLLLVLLGLLVFAQGGRRLMLAIFRLKFIRGLPMIARLQDGLERVLDVLKHYHWRDYLEWSLISMVEWFINYGAYHVILLGIGLRPRFFDTVVSVTFAALSSVLPVNSFGNFGTQEAGWATGLILLGYSQEVAITSGFATHLLTLAYMLIFGGFAWLTYLLPFPGAARPGPAEPKAN